VDSQAVRQLYDTLQRYAGWLDRERSSVQVRADVVALGAALESSTDPGPPLQSLETNLSRLPGSDLRKMLRTVAGKLRHAVEHQP